MANGQKKGISAVELATIREIKSWMARRGVQQKELAEALGYTQSAISLKLSGKTGFMLRDLAQIAEYLHVNLTQLLGEVGTAELVRSDAGAQKAPSPSGEEASMVAPPTGLEPVTLRLTVECSAN